MGISSLTRIVSQYLKEEVNAGTDTAGLVRLAHATSRRRSPASTCRSMRRHPRQVLYALEDVVLDQVRSQQRSAAVIQCLEYQLIVVSSRQIDCDDLKPLLKHLRQSGQA